MFSYLPYRVARSNENNPFDDLENAGCELMRSARLGAFRTNISQQQDGSYLLEAELPGFEKDNISIDLKDDVLTVSASRKEEKEEKDKKYIRKERYEGTFSRSFDVSGIDQENISAAYDNGVLKLTLPVKAEPKEEMRKITIG